MRKRLLLLAFSLGIFTISYGQGALWNPSSATGRSATLPAVKGQQGKTFVLDIETLKKALDGAPQRGHIATRAKTVIEFPDANGKMERFSIVEAPVMHPGLAAKYPDIKSYAGQGIDNPAAVIRFSISHRGLHSMRLSPDKGTVFIEPLTEDRSHYIVYDRQKARPMSGFECTLQEEAIKQIPGNAARNADDSTLRTYRLAVSTTGEYTQYFGGTKEDALAAINTSMTRVNGLFENDFAITMILIENNDEVIYTDPATDPYTGSFNSQLQNTLTNVIGEENYDIGHLFVYGSDNGNAGCIGCVCEDNRKGSAFTSHSTPEGDRFDVDYVAHEMGHQFGANHTFTIRNEGTGAHYEPGSGSTIMGYAGITGAADVQPHSDPYFHAFSIEQVANYVKTTTCQTDTPTGNNVPTANAGPDYTIPRGTAFFLTGEGTDADSEDELTYCWEQMDEDGASSAFPSPTATTGPVFRSVMPSTSPVRYFPAIPALLQGSTASQWEVVPEVARELNFRLTVRDNRAGGAANNSDDVTITVTDEAGPFVVTSHETSDNVVSGSTQTVTWDVAGTDSGPINVQEVDILLADADDPSLLIPLASGVPNNGTHEVTFPQGINIDRARIVIRATDHIFFAVSKGDLSIREFNLIIETTDFIVCKPDDLEFSFIYQAAPGFDEEITFSATNVPEGMAVSFDPETTGESDTAIHVSVSGTDSLDTGAYSFTITGDAGGATDEIPITLEIHNSGDLDIPVLVSPFNAGTVSTNISLEWEEVTDAISYVVEVATDEDFTAIVDETEVTTPHHIPEGLEFGNTYYWRVKPISYCGEGAYSDIFYFYTSTSAPRCHGLENNTPVDISSSEPNTVTTAIEVEDTGFLRELTVGVNITHTWVSDLAIDLTSPSGTTVRLLNRVCGSNNDINAVFSDEGVPLECGVSPAVSGIILPEESLSAFAGEPVNGEWILTVHDLVSGDGGAINSFSLDMCTQESSLSLSPDNFTLKSTSETCRNNRDGSISVEADEILNYHATLTGGDGTEITGSFQYFWKSPGLAAGSYSLCITVEDQPGYEQCFDMTITQPEELSVLSTISRSGKSVDLELGGGELYTIELNGKITQTTDDRISLDLTSGENSLTITADKDCQGTYKENIYVAPDDVLIYPNPFHDTTRAFIGNAVKGDIQVAVFNLAGRLVSSEKYDRYTRGDEIELRTSALSPGVYLIKVKGEQFEKTFKVVKL